MYQRINVKKTAKTNEQIKNLACNGHNEDKDKTKTMRTKTKDKYKLRTWQAMVTMRTTAMALVAAFVQYKAPA